ncbi:MAG TPA: endonuclease III [Candidatus Absconditabacterales bacterium]|nr:endonuclease III [Candidatus Absconditabacterales bacterium]
MNKENIDFLFTKLGEMYPDANTELKYSNAFQLLISVVLSAQATDKQVNKITNSLYKKIKSPKDVLDMGLSSLTKNISSINYYKTKAKNIFETSKMLNEDPTIISPDIDILQKLPGVGIKTAKVISYVLFGSKVIAADTHVHRVSNRLGLVDTKVPEKTSELLEKKVPDKYKGVAHHGLILFGRYHCIARKPKCETCPFKDICKFHRASLKKGGRA